MSMAGFRRLLFLVLAAVALVAITASAPAYAKSKSNVKSSKKTKQVTVPTKQQVKFEQDFLKKMIDRHQRAIQVATWIDQNTSITELNAFAELFIEREQAEMALMQGALQSWYQINYTPKNKPLDPDDFMDLIEADNPVEFALAALEFFKGYDQSEASQMKQVAKKAYHAELKTFATDVISIDKAEVSFLKEKIKILEGMLGEGD